MCHRRAVLWRLPAEWEPQEAVWLVWPRDPETWPGRVDKVRTVFVQTMRAMAPQTVHLVVHPDLLADARAALVAMPHVNIHSCIYQDSWIRDYGPLTLVDDQGGRKALKFQFDAWGGKYESLMADDAVVPRLVAAGAMPAVEAVPFVLEGGAVETDGQGTFLATESVAAGRRQSVPEHESALRTHLGARQVIWLGEGITGDDTDGHVDTITRFVAPGKVVTAVAPAGHRDHAALADNRRRLAAAVDARGRRLDIVDLPVPRTVRTDDGKVLPAGYANFLITNHSVLVPQYGGDAAGRAADARALAMVGACFPGRRAVGLPHEDLIWGFGGIHCLSMQVPAVG